MIRADAGSVFKVTRGTLWIPEDRTWVSGVQGQCLDSCTISLELFGGLAMSVPLSVQTLLCFFPGCSQAFLKFATTEAIQRTEIFEYCRVLGRPQSFLPSFQVSPPSSPQHDHC